MRFNGLIVMAAEAYYSTDELLNYKSRSLLSKDLRTQS